MKSEFEPAIMCCEHENTLFDEATNSHVCVQCGLVRENFAAGDLCYKPTQWSEMPSGKTLPTYTSRFAVSDGLDLKEKQKWNTDNLERVCGNFHIPTCVESDVRYLLQSSEYAFKRNNRYTRDMLLMSHALYTSCIKNDCPRSADVIASYFQVDLRSFHSICNEFEYVERKLLPSDLLPPIKSQLLLIDESLHYKDFVMITNTADRICKETCNSPPVVLAVCIFLFLKYHKSPKSHITVKIVSKLCNVSMTSMTKLKHKLVNMHDLFR